MSALRRIRHTVGLPPLLALIMFLIGEAISQIVFEFLGPIWAQVAYFIVLVGIACALGWRYDHRRRSETSSVGQPGDAKLSNRRGAVVLIGLDSDDPTGPLAKLFARTPQLEQLALIGTPQTAERGVSERLRTSILASWGVHLDPTKIRVYEHNHAESVADNDHSVADALRWMIDGGLTRSEIIVDVTKGRRPMGYGALAAADRQGVEAQYLTWAWDTVTDQPIIGAEAFKLIAELYPDHIDTNDSTAPVPAPV